MLSAILYAEVYGVCFLVILILLLFSIGSESRSVSERWLIRLFVMFLCTFGANLLYSLFSSGLIPLPWPVPVSYGFKTLYFLSLTGAVFCWCCYAEAEMKSDMRRKPWLALGMVIIFLIPAAMIVINLWMNNLFEIDAQVVYHRKPLYHSFMLFLVAVTLVFSVRNFLRSLHESDPIVRSHIRLIISFPFALILAWMFTQLGEQIPVLCVCMTLELLCLYIGTNRQQISMDKLTQVNNRQNLLSFMNYKLATHESRLFLMMIDLDYFKTINDTYGHLEGDNALIRVAESMKQACMAYKKRPYIARYGGDEFMIVLEGTRQEASDLRDSIRAILQEKQARCADYPLTVSIGLAECECGMRADDLIELADAEMYKLKAARKKQKQDAAHHGHEPKQEQNEEQQPEKNIEKSDEP